VANHHPLAVPPSNAAELEAFAGDPDFMLSLAKGMLIFRAFADKRQKLTIAQISAATGLKRSTAYRCLYTLMSVGYLENEGGLFSARASVLGLASAYFEHVHLELAVQPILDRLRDSLAMTCAIGIYDDGNIYYVVVSRALGSMPLIASVGRRLPAYCTAVGRIFLSELPAESLNSYLDELSPVSFTPNTATIPAVLRNRIEEVRAQGYAVAAQEIDIGVKVISVPIRADNGQLVAALMAGGEISSLTDEKIRMEFLPALQKAAIEIGRLWRNF
jgi:IclR family pca regulon transcriptional regulator